MAWELCNKQILTHIAKAIGDMIKIYNATLLKEFDQYARVLIYINLARKLEEQVMGEVDSFKNFVNLYYENVSNLYSICFFMGHANYKCQKMLILR